MPWTKSSRDSAKTVVLRRDGTFRERDTAASALTQRPDKSEKSSRSFGPRSLKQGEIPKK